MRKRRKIVYNPGLRELAGKLRNNMTFPEKKLWYDFLSGHKFRFLRQKPLLDYVVDFYCPRLKLFIEVDGESHFTEESRKNDIKRTEDLANIGLKEIRFTNDDVFNNFKGVCKEINRVADEIMRKNEIPASAGK
jgi:very-short-patch-repair endonuclease